VTSHPVQSYAILAVSPQLNSEVSATQTILSKIPVGDGKLTYAWEQYLFHYIAQDGVVYLVMADDSAGRCVSLCPP
jgi:hypothetical protein